MEVALDPGNARVATAMTAQKGVDDIAWMWGAYRVTTALRLSDIPKSTGCNIFY